ncbi:MAG: hypothetical protein ACK4MQ_00035 [Hyphomonas sp.]
MLRLRMYSRFDPLPGLTWLQWLLWPLIFARLMAVKLRVRAQYGRGVPYHCEIGPLGQVWFMGLRADPDQVPVCVQLFDAASRWGEAEPAVLPPRLAALIAGPATGAVLPARFGNLRPLTVDVLRAAAPAPDTS